MPADFNMLTNFILNSEGDEQGNSIMFLLWWSCGKEWLMYIIFYSKEARFINI